MYSTAILSIVIFIPLLCLPAMHECCTKLTTIDTTRQSLKIRNRTEESNVLQVMNPFLIRSENGNIAITLSEYSNDTNTRCYQIFIEDGTENRPHIGCLQISDIWSDSRDQHSPSCKKQFLIPQDTVEFLIAIKISSGGVIELKINNQIRFIYKDRKSPIDVKHISVASTRTDSYNEFYFNCFDETTNTIKYHFN